MQWLFSFVLICLYGLNPTAILRGSEREQRKSNVEYVGRASALEAVIAVALQTQSPIGIVPGRNSTSLCGSQYPFDLRGMDVATALLDIGRRAQYSFTQENNVFILMASDTTPRQVDVLRHRFKAFKPGADQTMHMLSFQLAGWLWAEVGHGQGYGGSILDSTDAPKVSLPAVLKDTTTKEIADRIVTSGKGGIWISQISPDNANGPNDFYVAFESYGDPSQLKQEVSCKW